MSQQFKKIGLIAKQKPNIEIIETLQILKLFLQSRQCSFVIETNTAAALPPDNSATLAGNQLGWECDLIIVIGGDGSLLNAAQLVVEHHVPILGINRGKLGFLADISPTEVSTKVGEVLDGNYIEETRFLLNSKIEHQHKVLHQQSALNDIVLMPGEVAQLIEFEIYINDQFVCTQRADGLIVATPTGSTAYALSGGGPILHPQLDAVALVPMFPHTLTSRPIVINANSTIKIVIPAGSKIAPRLSCDGRERIHIKPGGSIFIHKKAEHLRLIHPLDYNYFETLRAKLHWERSL